MKKIKGLILFVVIVGGLFWLISYQRSCDEAERIRPMTSEERATAIKSISRGFDREFTDDDFKGASEADLRAVNRMECGSSYIGSWKWTCGWSGSSLHTVEGHSFGFVAQNTVYAIDVWRIRYVYLPERNLYLGKQYYAGSFDSAEELSEKEEIPLADAQRIWNKTKR